MKYCLGVISLILINELYEIVAVAADVDCNQLRVGQYMCPDPDVNHIDPKTQQPIGCSKNNVAKVWCKAADGLVCKETGNYTFQGKETICDFYKNLIRNLDNFNNNIMCENRV